MKEITITGGSNIAITNDVVSKEAFDEVKDDIKAIKDKIFEVKNPTQYIFINKSLKMNPGKVAAQISHAQEELFSYMMTVNKDKLGEYQKMIAQNPRTTIVLEVKDTDELYKVNSYLESCNIITAIYVDEKGENYNLEPTVLITNYVDKTDERMKIIFDDFPLYKAEELEEEDVMKIEDFYFLKSQLWFYEFWVENSGLFNIYSRKEALKEIRQINEKIRNHLEERYGKANVLLDTCGNRMEE